MKSKNKSGANGVALCLVLSALAHPVFAESVPDAALADLSLEELLKTEVQTASRKSQRLQDVAAAAFVITREDIERSGATSLPEALRLAPGVQVARLANNRWAVSARGFNGRFANKLLVLMDGRSIYSPLFSGVVWEMEDTLLEDIDRIEVIRGPGAALWGANAVNGVINILTRHSRDTRGTLAVAGAGTEERAFTALRHGVVESDHALRFWAKAFKRDTSKTLSGTEGNDDWKAGRLGFRGDWTLATDKRLTVSGSVFGSPNGDRWIVPTLMSPRGAVLTDVTQEGKGAHLLMKHEWLPSDGSSSSLQLYVDHTDLAVAGAVHERRTTVDVDFQRRLAPLGRHDMIWGASLRFSQDEIDSGGMIRIAPRERSQRLGSVFVHDEITLMPERLRLVIGARLEHNSYTGLEPQPNARLMWTPSPQQALWTAVSRAVRTPSRAEGDSTVDLAVIPAGPMSPPVVVRSLPPLGDASLQSEHVTAVEIGWRRRFEPNLSLDVALFHNRYDGLRSGQAGAPSLAMAPFPHVVQPVHVNNAVAGTAAGAEIAVDWHPMKWWRLQASTTLMASTAEGASGDLYAQATAQRINTSVPRRQLSLRSSMSLAQGRQLDLWLRHVSGLGAPEPHIPGIPAYTTLDLRYAWRPWRGVELSVTGQNLLDAQHPEFVPDLLPSETMQVQRGVYAKAKWQF